jgi:hypothetical protein
MRLATEGPPIPRQLLDGGSQDLYRSLKAEMAGMRQQLEQLLDRQTASQAVNMQMDQLLEGQASVQSSLSVLKEAVGNLRSPVKEENERELSRVDVGTSNQNGENPVLEAKLMMGARPLNIGAEPSDKAKSAFAIRADERRRKRLHRIFEVDEEEERYQKEQAAIPYHQKLSESSSLQLEVLDVLALLLIVINVFVMGIRVDAEDEGQWLKFDIIFATLFSLELAWRLKAHGFVDQFCKGDALPRIFDAGIIVVDVIFVVFQLAGTNLNTNALSASLFRIVRLGRFIRVLRVLKTNVFSDLLGMMQGIVGGIKTLQWAAILFILLTFVAALVCREALGRREEENVTEYFSTVPRSMFTIFRCSFGDCSSSGGVPIFEHVTEAYGGFYALLYCSFIFTMSIGLFNVISAIFVDVAIRAASEANATKRLERLNSEKLMSVNASILVRQVAARACSNAASAKLSDSFEDLMALEVDRSVLDAVVKEPEAVRALNSLDIDPDDHNKLSDILDPDHGGTVSVIDLVNGLQRLRGEPRRSDIISVNLMIRSLQDKVEEILDKVVNLKKHQR